VAEFYEMPAISPTMEVGTLVEWKIPEGAAFSSGTIVAEVGTDKANMEAEVFDDGVMLKHLVSEGDEIPPGQPIAIIGTEAGEDISALLAEYAQQKTSPAEPPAAETPAPVAAPAPAPPAAPATRSAPAARPATQPSIDRSWDGKALTSDFMDPPGDLQIGRTKARVAASPLARAVASDLGVDLHRVTGSGPGGRIVRADVDAAAQAPAAAAGPAPRADQTKRNSPMRKTIAKRLLSSHQDIPTFFLTATFDMQGFVDLRTALKAQLPDVRVSYNDILIKAVARALVDHPEVNASWSADSIVHHGRVDIGVAVAVAGGLITPVVRNADQKPLSVIGGEVRELAGRARKQKLQPDEYTGGTFTISNLGMMEIDHFTAIINPPEAAILAVGRIAEEPVVVDGELIIANRMRVTMTCDHRVIDGAVGATFLQTLRRYVENPYLLLV
jgi:pyruvate dehydrogenase E2 component (dihydrolipoamide acetyltransferase)